MSALTDVIALSPMLSFLFDTATWFEEYFDHTELSGMARVCRAFRTLPYRATHLVLTPDGDTSYRTALGILSHSRTITLHLDPCFVESFDLELQRLPSTITNMTLIINDRTMQHTTDTDAWAAHNVHQLVRSLPRLTELALVWTGNHCMNMDYGFLFTLLLPLEHLERLEVVANRLPGIRDFEEFVASMPRLQHWRFDDGTCLGVATSPGVGEYDYYEGIFGEVSMAHDYYEHGA